MRLLFSSLFLLLGCIGLVRCKSAVGDRILVVLEDGGERNSYSQFWADLECESHALAVVELLFVLTKVICSQRFQVDLRVTQKRGIIAISTRGVGVRAFDSYASQKQR